MSDYVEIDGRDFPVYDSFIVANETKDIQRAARSSHETFVRRARLTPTISKHLPLGEILDYADSEFAAVAKFCGGVVVEHTWGVAEHSSKRQSLSAFGKPSYDLVAEVETISKIKAPFAKSTQLHEDLIEHERRNTSSFIWTDAAVTQFAHGISRNQPTPTLHLVDIDILFLRNYRNAARR